MVILLLELEELAKVLGELGSTPAMGESATSTKNDDEEDVPLVQQSVRRSTCIILTRMVKVLRRPTSPMFLMVLSPRLILQPLRLALRQVGRISLST